MDKIYLAQLQLLSAIIAVYFLLLTTTHALYLEPNLRLPVGGSSLLACIVTTVIHCMVRFGKLPARYSHWAFVPVAVLSTISVFMHIVLSQDEMQMTHAFIIIVVFSIVSLSPLLYSVALAVATSAFLLALYIIPNENDVHLVFTLLIIVGTSSLGFMMKFRTIYKSVILVHANRDKAESLAAASQQMKEQIAKVQKANVAKDQFIANITHELRTPLTGTMGMLELLDHTDLDKQQSFLVETAQKSSNYLLNVVNDMIALGSIDAGKLILAEEGVDLVALTHEVLDEYRAVAEDKEITLTSSFKPAGTILVKSDAARIVQLLSKLVCNAVKFTEEGGVLVSLEWRPTEGGKTGKAIWRVADTGPGIPRDSISSMFNRFEQSDQTITRMTSGTGLGLSVVKEVIEFMKGTIDVKSDVDKGAVFKISLDLEAWTKEMEQAPSAGTPEELAANLEAMPIRVLLAEDNRVNQLVITKMLQKLKAEVTVVGNGQLAVDAVAETEKPFDLICMDIQMPILDGLSAAKVIMIKSKNPPPIVAVTANTGDHDIIEYRNAGIEAVVTKPINFNHFRAVVLSVVQAHKKKKLASGR
ncbi:MAG: response regulator [Kordiimonadaceae bacterium]|nr:response regulator [Kordiimonadaceae bacterium]